jgi:hypothetical protein
MTSKRILFALCLSLGCFLGRLPAAAEDERESKAPALRPDEADSDFPLQGEYVGAFRINEQEIKFGIQVIALGDGKFESVAYHGGLPGDGWDQTDPIRTSGSLKDGAAVFENDHAVGIAKGDQFRIENKEGVEIGNLKRAERKNEKLGLKPPAGAMVLFDGTSADHFEGGKMTEGGLLIQGTTSRQTFQDCTLHLEFMLSYMPHAREQQRSNSGCYLQGRYEVQILDSFGLTGENNECGGIYGIKAPDLNMCLPPLAWQTYDIDFTAARFDENGEKTADARMTVMHNGVPIHNDVPVPSATRAAPVAEGPEPGPLYLQDHGNPIRFRNIWLVVKE